MSVGEHCRRDPLTVAAAETVRETAKQMATREEGCVVVVDEDHRPVGVLTDRDIALGVVRKRLDPAAVAVEEVMHRSPVTLRESGSLVSALRRMRAEGVRRLPVVEGSGRLVGVFDWNDALGIVAEELSLAAQVARAQIQVQTRPGAPSAAEEL